jgi:hypothetical protein
MRALLLNSSVLVIKKVWWKICGLEFLANFILVALANYARTPNKDWKAMLVRTSPKESMPGLSTVQYKSRNRRNIFCSFQDNFRLKVHMNVIRNNEIYWFSKNL